MARKRNKMGGSWRLYCLATITLALLGTLIWYWWDLQQWTPPEEFYPEQGVVLSERQGLANFDTARALGASFVYLEASTGADGRDKRLGRNLAAARRARLLVGAIQALSSICCSFM